MKNSRILSILVVAALLFSTMMVLNKLEVTTIENASAQPGVDVWGNATTDLVYDTSYASGAVKINTSQWGSTGTYYLYYPVYTCTGAGPNADSFAWAGPYKVGVASVNVVSTQGNNDVLDTGGSAITFNRSGMWIFDDDSTHTAGNPASYAGYIWVNTSTEYVISSVADFQFGSSGSKTITVDTGDDSGCMISIIAPDNTTVYHKWRATGQTPALKIAGNFTMVGDYSIRAYRDFDEDDYVYLYADGETGYEAYNGSYGSGPSFPADGTWNYTNVGPWDPPEKNATEATFSVTTGEPNIVLTNDTVYWGFGLRMDVNVTAANGSGITGGTVRLRKGDTYLSTEVWINETGNGNYSIEIPRHPAGGSSNWTTAPITNGTWRVVFNKDINSDGTDEWNNSKRFSIKSTSPPVRIQINNDGSGTSTDKKVNVPAYTGDGDDAADTINIDFTILGRSISDDEGRAYYGDDAHEDEHNITISGDILYTPKTGWGTLIDNDDGTWRAIVTPTTPGGTITIEIDWPGNNNGSASETIEIVNGTFVTPSVEMFTVGEHINLTITVKDMDGDPIKTSKVYLFWKGGGAGSDINSTTGNNKAGKGQNGEYKFWIKPDEQGSTAPKNITIAASWPGQNFWGYAKVKMVKNHNMMVNVTPTTSYAGDATEYDIDVNLVGGGRPEKSGLTVAIYNETGALVSGMDAWSKTGAYDINDEEIPLSGGTYYLYAYNNTHDSQGHNATLNIAKYTVTSSPSVLAWLIDTSTNMTFQVNSPTTNGTLYVENMSTTPNASAAGETETVDIVNGVGTLEGVNATTLGNITFDYQPEDGEQRPADGLVRVTTATATPSPETVYIGEPTIVEITITHPATGEPLEDVRVGLDTNVKLNESLSTLLIKIPDAGFTDADGKVWFSIETGGSGNVTIFVENATDPDNPFVIKSSARRTLDIALSKTPIYQKETLTVTVTSQDKAVEGVAVTFAGLTVNTDASGMASFTVPDPGVDFVVYTITAKKTGYITATGSVTVLKKWAITILGPSTAPGAGQTFTVTILAKGAPLAGALITIDGDSYTSGGDGKVTITAPSKEGSYTITAKFEGFEDGTLTITIKAGGIPGFELLSLIAAIGVAFILLRRRRS